MPTSAPGNKPRPAAGFSLLELMVVLLLVAVATGLASLSLRDSSQDKVEEEAVRLAAILESARTQSRILGTDVGWAPNGDSAGFHFIGLSPLATAELPSRWLDDDTQAQVVGAAQLRLGPEPLLAAQRVVLSLHGHQATVGTDGLSPFEIVTPDAVAATP